MIPVGVSPPTVRSNVASTAEPLEPTVLQSIPRRSPCSPPDILNYCYTCSIAPIAIATVHVWVYRYISILNRFWKSVAESMRLDEVLVFQSAYSGHVWKHVQGCRQLSRPSMFFRNGRVILNTAPRSREAHRGSQFVEPDMSTAQAHLVRLDLRRP